MVNKAGAEEKCGNDKRETAQHTTQQVHHVVAEQIRRIETASKVGTKEGEETRKRSYAEAASSARDTKPQFTAAKAAAKIEVRFEKKRKGSLERP